MAKDRKPLVRLTAAPKPKPLSGSSGDAAAPDPGVPPAVPEPKKESKTDLGFDGFGSDGDDEDSPAKRPNRELKAVEAELVNDTPEGRGWRIASNMVNRFRPVPHLVWPIVHSVYGRPGHLGKPDAMMFSALAPLVIHGATDRTLSQGASEIAPEGGRSLTESVAVLGADVSAALCLVHAVCRKIGTTIPEKVARPILDDALLRTHIGFYVGLHSEELGPGRGMIAGFAGRCGLAVQIASGETQQASRALTGMASGQDMAKVCATVYGCDPLEVAALALIGGGCCREVAFGISSYSSLHRDCVQGTDQYRWLSLFSIIEATRMGQAETVSPEHWRALGYDPAGQKALEEKIMNSQRRGHGWNWITQPTMGSAATPSQLLRRPAKKLEDDLS